MFFRNFKNSRSSKQIYFELKTKNDAIKICKCLFDFQYFVEKWSLKTEKFFLIKQKFYPFMLQIKVSALHSVINGSTSVLSDTGHRTENAGFRIVCEAVSSQAQKGSSCKVSYRSHFYGERVSKIYLFHHVIQWLMEYSTDSMSIFWFDMILSEAEQLIFRLKSMKCTAFVSQITSSLIVRMFPLIKRAYGKDLSNDISKSHIKVCDPLQL